jgi:hypothetical protein
MKALSFRQPWAELILQGRKTMDLRTYNTSYRGPLAIHVPQKVENEAAGRFQLDPSALVTGGIVGTADLVDVILLDEAAYESERDQHLAGRRFREGLYGWVLANPQRLPELLPMPGRRNLFNVDLKATAMNAPQPASPPPPSPKKRQPIYELEGTTPEKPFALLVRALAGETTDYALTLRQRIVEQHDRTPRLETIATISGDSLRGVADHVIEALRSAGYKATDLSPARTQGFYLSEEIGVRLGLVFLAVRPLSKPRRVEEISYGIRQMPSEEAYYWYSKCTAVDTAERAQKALRVLLAAE